MIRNNILAKTTAFIMALSLLVPSSSSALELVKKDFDDNSWALVKEELHLTDPKGPEQYQNVLVNQYEYNDDGSLSVESISSDGSSKYEGAFKESGAIKYDKKGKITEITINKFSTYKGKQEDKYTYKNNLLLSRSSIFTSETIKTETTINFDHNSDNTVIYTGSEKLVTTDLQTNDKTTKYFIRVYQNFSLDRINCTYSRSQADESFNPISNDVRINTDYVSEYQPRKGDIEYIKECQFYPTMSFKNSKENIIEYNEDKSVKKITYLYSKNILYVYDNMEYDSHNNLTKCNLTVALYNDKAEVIEPGTVIASGTASFTWKKLEKKEDSTKDPSSGNDPSKDSSTNGDKTPGSSNNSTNTKPQEYTDKNVTYQITKKPGSNNEIGEMTYVRSKKKTKKVVIPASVKVNNKTYLITAIDANAFKNDTKLKSITIGKNIKKIGKNTFKGCKNLKTIKIKTTKLTKKAVGKNAFSGIHKKAKVTVPKAKLKAYKKILKARGIKQKTQKIVSSAK